MTASPKTRSTKATTRPKTGSTKIVARKTGSKKAAISVRSQSTLRAAAQLAMREGFDDLIRPDKPRAEQLACATAPKTTKGKIDYVTAHTMSTPDMIALICHGFEFGTGVAVVYVKTPGGWSFEGSRPFCHIKKCSDGTSSTDTVSVKGTIAGTPWQEKLAFTYEARAYCGGVVTCIETGTFEGKKISAGIDLLEATYQGPTSWTLTCCSDPIWKYSINPSPPLAVRGRYIEPGRSRKKQTGK